MIRRMRLTLLPALVIACLTPAGGPGAADHDDTNLLKSMPRHEARLTDLHVFRGLWQRGKGNIHPTLVLAVSTNPTIPPTAGSYLFPSDMALDIRIDRSCDVDFEADPAATQTWGGTILQPELIHADIGLNVTFDAAGSPRLATSGLDPDTPIRLFAGLRDDPFIRGPRQGRNVASIVIEVPLRAIAVGNTHRSLLVWAVSSVPGPTGPTGDHGGRALRSQFAQNLALNDFEPADHFSVLGVVPDVVIFDTLRPAAYPNGRRLIDDVVDLVGDPDILATDCPVPGDPVRCNPAANDVAFLTDFPYLAPPHGVATGNLGTLVAYPPADQDR